MEYHRIYAKIDLDAIADNLKRIRSGIPENTGIMAIIKANAYGHGAVVFAKYLSEMCDCFGVANIDEAIELRNAGVEHPILLLGYTSPVEYSIAVSNNIAITVFSLEDAEVLGKTARNLGLIAKVHLAVDTGMSRIGFQVTEEDVSLASKIFCIKGVEVEGIFSHYATADDADKTFAYKQKELFDKFISRLECRGHYPRIRHISNSAAIMEIKDSCYEMVRAGIMLYGLYPSDEMDKGVFTLSPAMELISHVSHIKTVPKGIGISYGQTYMTDKETKIATIPVGYADGYPRALSNKGRVLINGVSCPILGRVCMDQMMVDVTHIESINVGDKVVLLGKYENETITVEELAEPAASFNYEFVCGIGHRVPRIYFRHGKKVETVSYLEHKNEDLK